MATSNFKVIVVGGGPVGLTAAIALERAGIDFIVLERRPEIVIDAGSNLVLSPTGLRALDQFGLRDAINAVSTPLNKIHRLDHKGNEIGDMNWFLLMKKQFGIAPRVISRHDLTKTLYNSLPTSAQAKIFSNKKLSDITNTPEGVVVHCADGASYSGSIVVGADGAHSMVRNIMQRMSESTEAPFLTTYRCLWVRFPTSSKLLPGTTCETHGHLAATQLFAGEDTAVIGVYERLDAPTSDRIRYTQADQDALVGRWGRIPVTPDKAMTLRDVYDSRLESGLVSLEEGVVKQWSLDSRIVLAGDAAHKFTPSTGAGCNNGIIDIVALVNELHSKIDGSLAEPERQQIESAFKAYQDRRLEAVEAGCKGSSQATAAATWQTGVHKIIDRHIMSWQTLQKYMFESGAKAMAREPVVAF